MKTKNKILFGMLSLLTIVSCGNDDGNSPTKGNNNLNIPVSGVIDGHQYVDLGLSVNWATCNIGASKPYENGSYYPFYYWGKQSAKSAPQKIYGSIWDRAKHLWGTNWRLPSYDEIKELANCEWSTITLNGTKGAKVVGPNGNFIFLPFSGHGYAEDISEFNYEGPYEKTCFGIGESVEIWSGEKISEEKFATDYGWNGPSSYMYLKYPIGMKTKYGSTISASSLFAIRPVSKFGKNNSNDNGNTGGNMGGTTTYEKPDIIYNSCTPYQTKLKVVYQIYNKNKTNVTSAKVYYGTTSNPTQSVTASVTSAQIIANISGLKKGTTYYVKCTATGKGGTTTTEVTKLMTQN